MAAYPFVKMPTLGEWIRRACDAYGCTLDEQAVTVLGPDGISNPSVLSRETSDDTFNVVLPYVSYEDRLTPHMLRNLCTRLGLPLSDFGLALTEEALLLSDDDSC